MRKHHFNNRRLFFVFPILLLLISSALPLQSALAHPTSAEDAEMVVLNWLALSPAPLGSKMADNAPDELISDVETFVDESENALFYVVYIQPKGFVIVSADDFIEPVIAFLPNAVVFDPSDDNPLGALVGSDIPGRLDAVREMNRNRSRSEAVDAAERKWDILLNPGIEPVAPGETSINDERVAPLVQSQWNQKKAGGETCYNYYTPKQYPCGCVATAMAQILRFHQWPSTGVGTGEYTIYVNGKSERRALRGGNGAGGPYNWANMPLAPGGGITRIQRKAIGALTHDAGVSVNMQYTSSGSGASNSRVVTRLIDLFDYSNAINGYYYNGGWKNIPSDTLNNMVIPNLDSGYPVQFGIGLEGASGGHAILCDGYGYNVSTLYHHLNMGWGGYYDAWYNLPEIKAGYTFDSVKSCLYNIYTSGSGEIISGRVTDNVGSPLSGVAISATPGGHTDVTDVNGIFALAKIASNTTFTLTATKAGYVFSPREQATGKSYYSSYVGNVWGVDFDGLEGCRWTGDVNRVWNRAGNWSDGSIPDDATDVLISLEPKQPIIRSRAAECNSITIESGTLTLKDNVLTIM